MIQDDQLTEHSEAINSMNERKRKHDAVSKEQIERNHRELVAKTIEGGNESMLLNPGDPSRGTSLEGYEELDYQPLWDFVLVEPLKESKKTAGGLHLPDGTKTDDTRRCKVVKAGPGSWINGVFIPNPIKVGQYIYNMAKHMLPYRVMIQGKLYLSMASTEVLAVASTSGLKEEEPVGALDDDTEV